MMNKTVRLVGFCFFVGNVPLSLIQLKVSVSVVPPLFYSRVLGVCR